MQLVDRDDPPDDGKLVGWIEAVAKHRDRAAFASLFAHFAPRVKGYLRRLGADDGAAEDLVQEVMLTLWRRAEQIRSPACGAEYLGIHDRAQPPHRLAATRASARQEIEDPIQERDPDPDGSEVAEAAQMRERVRGAMAGLPAEQAELVRIFYFEEKSHSEIAGELDLPLGTVKSRLRLALGKLRAALGSVVE